MKHGRRILPLLVLVALAGCEQDYPEVVRDTCQLPNVGVISSNHGHTIDPVCSSDRGAPLTLPLERLTHEHVINLTEEQVDLILNGNMVQVLSTIVEQHNHVVTFN